ncbi:Phage protein [Lactiplantibacillus plantarum]|nr:Phage protein [Lactiplantibacillus plantarum]
MADITHGTWIKDGKAVDNVFSNGKQVYGRNLVIGSSNELKTVTGSGWGSSPANSASGTYGAGNYYASAYIENTTPVGMTIFIHVNGHVGNFFGTTIQSGQSGVVSCAFNILDGQSLGSAWVGFASSQTQSYTYKYKEMMVTRTPSSWSPAPEDILN